MILRFLPSGVSNGDAPIKYLLSKNNSDGVERNPPPFILYGNPDVTKALIDTCPRKFKYTSAVIAFRDNEHPTNQQLAEVIRDLRETLAPGMGPERINMFAVLHRDKGNTEAHIIFGMTDLLTGKQYNVMPPGKAGKQLASDWQASWNHKLKFDQVVENPLKTVFSSLDHKIAKFANPTELMQKRFRTKKKLSEIIAEKIESGQFKDRNDLVSYFKSAGMVITRMGRDYISVRGSDPKAKVIRLRGKPYTEGVNYSDLFKQYQESAEKESRLSDLDAFMVNLRLERSVSERLEFIKQRDAKIPQKRIYSLPGHPKVERAARVKIPTRRGRSQKALENFKTHLNIIRTHQSVSVKTEERIQPVDGSKNSPPHIYGANSGSKKQPRQNSSSSDFGSLPSSDLDASIAQVESEIRGATVAMNSAKDPRASVQAQMKLVRLQRKLFELQEKKRVESIRLKNVPKPIPGFF